MKIACTPLDFPIKPRADRQYVLYGRPSSAKRGTAGPTLLSDLRSFSPSPRAWDFLSIALSVVAADTGCPRDTSSDGWTRQIGLQVAVADKAFWDGQVDETERMLCVLTGDIWRISFTGGGIRPRPQKKRVKHPEDSVCLLSGGADSLVGAIDMVARGKTPLFASQVSDGDKDKQKRFAATISPDSTHLQLNHNIRPRDLEISYRARSIIFFAYGILAATSTDRYGDGDSVDLYYPENGFISLNVPLTPLRLGSLSTRTTHPVFIANLQKILNAAKLRVRLTNPYQFTTKGEMLRGCKNQKLLKKLAFQTSSCGRSIRIHMHCGRCVPCIVRRAAFLKWGVSDRTDYKYEDLSAHDSHHSEFDDVRSSCFAVEQVRLKGIDYWIGGALNSAQLGDVSKYRAVTERGLAEIGRFLKLAGVS
jgi:hypothetical protein